VVLRRIDDSSRPWSPSLLFPYVLPQRFRRRYPLRVPRSSSAVLCHTNGRGLPFQIDPQRLMSAARALTVLCAERCNIRRASTANQRSTRLSHELDVVVEVEVEAGVAQQPGMDRRCLVGRGLVQHKVHVEVGGHGLVNQVGAHQTGRGGRF
jgi:hypothetical protein